MRVKVYSGYHHGRVLVLPEGTREGDLVELPLDLPAGETFAPGRTNPELHRDSRLYKVTEGSGPTHEKYLANIGGRFVRTVDVPPPPSIPVTVHLR